MQLVILMVGKTRAAFIQEGMDFYQKTACSFITSYLC